MMFGVGRTRVWAFTLLFPLSAHPSLALVAEPHDIAASIPTSWHGPVAKFLEELRTPNVQDVLLESRAERFDDRGRIVLRLISSSSCTSDRDVCMTVIGHISNDLFTAEAIFWAGQKIQRLDVAPVLLGVEASRSKPTIFTSPKGSIAVIDTTKGLMVIPQEIDDRKSN